jgi:hypothetical protein
LCTQKEQLDVPDNFVAWCIAFRILLENSPLAFGLLLYDDIAIVWINSPFFVKTV